jgi:ankyrin repeat protein
MNVETEQGSVSANDQLVSDSIRSTTSLPCLGNDVLLLIADCLESEQSINALVRTNRRLYLLLNSYLYRYNVVNAKSSALHWAAIHGQKRSAAESIAQAGELESKDYRYGRTPLCQAAENGHTPVVNLLLEAGAEFEVKDKSGRTPLSIAAEKGQDAVISVLLKAGAEFEVKDNFGWTPLGSAIERGHEAVVKLLLYTGINLESRNKYRTRRGLLAHAVKGQHDGIVKLLIEAGVELEHKDNRGRTPLSWAAAIEHGHFTIAKLLVEAGAELEPKDDRGRTPLSWAKWKNRRDIVKLLLDAGAENLDKNGHRTFQVHLKEAGSSLRNTVLGRR